MVSRMEKYYKNNSNDIKKRSQKNVDLYHTIYSEGQYSNIEGIATMDKTNEVDITKVKNMIKNRENYKRQKEYRNLRNIEEEIPETTNDFVEKEEKVYDIRDILNKAKDKKPEEDTPRSLDNTNYNILKDLKLNSKKEKNKEYEEEELKELINTITNTSMLNQMNDQELGLNMLDLQDTDMKLESSKSVQQLLEQARKYQEKEDTNKNLDKSFFTSSLNFSKDDFEDAEEYLSKKKSKGLLKRIVLFIFLLAITTSIIVGVYMLIK